MSKKIKVAVIGLGYWGPNIARNIHSLDDCELAAICDLRKDRLDHVSQRYPSAKACSNVESVLNDREIDAVAIATPLHTHFSLVMASLKAGKHVLVEKPLAATSEQCVELTETAAKRGLVLMVGHTFLYSPEVSKLKEIIDSGDLGTIRHINSRRLNLGLFHNDINVAWDLAPHDISIILHLLGEAPVSVYCSGAAHVTSGVEDVTTMSLNFPHRKTAVIASSWIDPRKVRETTIVGSKRMAVFDDVEPREKIRIYDARVERPPHYDTFAEFHYAYHHGDVQIPFVQPAEPLRNECQHFLDCIIRGISPRTPGEAGTQVVKVLEAATESLNLNGVEVQLEGTRRAASTPLRAIRPYHHSHSFLKVGNLD